jgi:hypothetical protein
MIKARSGNTVILGLEAGNIKRLKEGDPMLIKLSDVGVPDSDIQIVIMYGDTQLDIMAAIERDLGLLTPKIDPVNDKPI